MARCAKIQQVYRKLFSTHHIVAIAFPTSPIVAPLINPNGDRRDAQIDLNGRRVNLGQTMFRNTRVTGALGAPGLSLPAGLTRQGLPVGLELDGVNGADGGSAGRRHAGRASSRSAARARYLSSAGSTRKRPWILPSSSTLMEFAAGVFGNPGIVMMSPQIMTTNSCACRQPHLADIHDMAGGRAAQLWIGRE